ncbi:hypothetical protein M9435_004129 [Picochlorum sp. BPE23]|nr:hypothetical protein M9435_004129 [Picochlorum sp. BPE23]
MGTGLLQTTVSKKEDDRAWRPLETGALLEPPRLSEEVNPRNLQGLFDDSSPHNTRHDVLEDANQPLNVYVRIRPSQNGDDCIYAMGRNRIAVRPPEGSLACRNGDCQREHVFTFSRAFGPETSQEEYFRETTALEIDNMVNKSRIYEGVFLSYGITAAGKTHTIQGTREDPGVIPLALKALFDKVPENERKIQVSYCEIYNESIHDLLSEVRGPPLKLMDGRDGRVNVAGLSWHSVSNAKEAWNTLRRGVKQRRKAETRLNFSSSRSHSVFSVRIGGTKKKISFVDLAGSERATRTGNVGIRLKEAVAINGSLMTLGRCLEALKHNQTMMVGTGSNGPPKMVPYRESKVTHLFRDVFHGYGRVILSVCVSPSAGDFDETVRVLKYAVTASKISTIECPEPPKRKIRNETPITLKRHRLIVEEKLDTLPEATEKQAEGQGSEAESGEVEYNIVEMEGSISIRSAIQEASPCILEGDVTNPDRRESVPSPAAFGAFENMRTPHMTDEEQSTVSQDDLKESLRSEIQRLLGELRSAEERALLIENEVREEVAAEMTQMMESMEIDHKKRLESDMQAFEKKRDQMQKKHLEEVEQLESAIATKENELKRLESTAKELETVLTERDTIIMEKEDALERTEKAFNDSLQEIERLHLILEQEQSNNAEMAKSLAKVLKEQTFSFSPNSLMSEDREGLELNQFTRRVTQIEANNAMEREMSDQLIDRLRRDNESLKQKLVIFTSAIECLSTPLKSNIMERILSSSPLGTGQGPEGTPHDIALARARRAVVEDQSKVSRFAKEIDASRNERDKAEKEIDDVIIDLSTPRSNTDGDGNQVEDKQDGLQQNHGKMTCADEPAEQPNTDMKQRKKIKNDSKEKKSKSSKKTTKRRKSNCSPEAPQPTVRVTRRMAKMRAMQEDTPHKSPSEEQENHSVTPKPRRKLLSTAKKPGGQCDAAYTPRILGISNKGKQSKKSAYTASDLGLTPNPSIRV